MSRTSQRRILKVLQITLIAHAAYTVQCKFIIKENFITDSHWWHLHVKNHWKEIHVGTHNIKHRNSFDEASVALRCLSAAVELRVLF